MSILWCIAHGGHELPFEGEAARACFSRPQAQPPVDLALSSRRRAKVRRSVTRRRVTIRQNERKAA